MSLLDTIIHRWLRVPYTLKTIVHNPKGKRTVVMIHGIGNSGKSWDPVIKKLPPTIKVVVVDLLGFGASPKPHWAQYNARTQARSVQATLLKKRILGRYTIVGHSLGSLVAIEMAKRYPLAVKSLILCSPPFYQLENPEKGKRLAPEDMLRRIYRIAVANPERFLDLATIAIKYKLVSPAFALSKETIGSYMATLETLIINQTSLRDAGELTLPIYIFRGALDPFVISSNLTKLKNKRENITLQTVAAAHEVRGIYATRVAGKIESMLRK